MTFTDAARDVVARDVAYLGCRRVARMLACDHTSLVRWLNGRHGQVMSDLLDAVVAVYGLTEIGAELRRANGPHRRPNHLRAPAGNVHADGAGQAGALNSAAA